MAEVVEKKHRWDAGAGTTALGIIGTTLVMRTATVAEGDSAIFSLSNEIRVYRDCCCQQSTPIQLALSISGGNGTLSKHFLGPL